MSVQSALVLKCNNGSPGAYQLIGGTASLIAANFGVAEGIPTGMWHRNSNRVVKFFKGSGASKVLLVAWIATTLYTFDGTSWTLRYTITSGLQNANGGHSGLQIATVNGVPTIVGMYEAAGGEWFGISSADGITWSNPDLGVNINTTSWMTEAVFNNVFYVVVDARLGHVSWDPATNAVTVNVGPDIFNDPMDLCVFNNALYKIAERSSVPGYWIWAFNLGGWTPILQLPAPGATKTTTTGVQALPSGTINVTSTTGFPASGNIYVTTTTGTQILSYTATTPTSFTGVTGGTGSTTAGGLVSTIVTGLGLQGNGSFTPGAGVSRPVLFDGGDGFMYAFYNCLTNSTTYGIAACKISATGLSATPFDVTAKVLPTTMQYPNGSSGPGNYSFSSLTETDSQPGAPVGTTVAAGSDGQVLPQTTINVADTTGFPASGSILIATTSGNQIVAYTGVTGTAFTGCTNGTGTLFTGGTILSIATPVTHLYLLTALSGQLIFYFAWNGPNTLIGNGGIPTDQGGDVSMAVPNVKAGGNDRIWVPSDFDTRVTATSNLAASQEIYFQAAGPLGTELKSFVHYFSIANQVPPAFARLSAPGVVNTTTTSVQALPQSTIPVASTVGFPSSGKILVTTDAGTQTITYTGTTATSFTGCTGGTGNTSNGGAVLSGPAPAPTLNANNRQLDGVTCDGNTTTPTTFKATWLSGTDGITSNQRVRTGQRVF